MLLFFFFVLSTFYNIFFLSFCLAFSWCKFNEFLEMNTVFAYDVKYELFCSPSFELIISITSGSHFLIFANLP